MGCSEVFENGCENFGSGQEGGDVSVPFPGFWGGARDSDVSMLVRS